MKFEILRGPPGPQTPVDVHDVAIPVTGLPAPLEGFRIAVVSDLHYGRFVREAFTRRIIDLVHAQRPDLVLLPGDMVNHMAGHASPCARLLAALRAPCGVLASLGNHDHYAGRRTIRGAFEEAGIPVLVNAHRVVARGGARFTLAAIDDWRVGEPDFAAALRGADPADPVVLMSHNPDAAEHLPQGARVDLMVSGHTHGGQVTLFGRPIVTRIQHRRYARGLVRGPRCLVYTSRGVGMVGAALRVSCRPEVPILRLTARTA